jgi:hypothetical protein
VVTLVTTDGTKSADWNDLCRSVRINSTFHCIVAGGQIGNVVTLPLSGVLCQYGFAGGWPSIFYVLGNRCSLFKSQYNFRGLLAMVWVFIWYLFVADTPSVHPKINRREQLYIETSLANEMRNDDKVVCMDAGIVILLCL